MDAMVSARVPVEIKKRGDGKLKEIGSNPTELVNAAYRYIIEHGELPGAKAEEPIGVPQTKTLKGSAAEKFTKQWKSRSILEAPTYDGSNFRELLDAAREERYAGLA